MSTRPDAPRISVLIPTYNRAQDVCRAVESVLAQTLPALEVIVVDDGSTDDTRAAVQAVIDQQGATKSIRYTHQDNRGKSAALNTALGHVRGDWIAYLDSDDVWLPEKLERQWLVLQEAGPRYGACVTNSRYVNHPDPKWQGPTFARMGWRVEGETGVLDDPAFLAGEWRGIFMQTVLVRTDVMQRVGPFDETLRIQVDRDFLFRLALQTPLCYVTEPLVEIDRTSGRKEGLYDLHSKQLFRLDHLRRMYEKWLVLASARPDLQRIIREQLRGTYSQMTNWYLSQGDDANARKAVSQAIRVQPTVGLAAKWLFTFLAPGLLRNKVKDRVTSLSKP